MKLIEQQTIHETPDYNPNNIRTNLERIGRLAWKSEDRIDEKSAGPFIKMLLSKQHLSVFEHEYLRFRFVTSRAMSHELVRHRLTSITQESQRYVNYSNEKNELTFIYPHWWVPEIGLYFLNEENYGQEKDKQDHFLQNCRKCEDDYKHMLSLGFKPQDARDVLTNSVKTELVITANIREWMHIVSLRCDKAAHPQMQKLILPVKQIIGEILQ